VKLVTAFLGHRKADQTAAVHSHEVDHLWRDHFRGADQVTLVFTIFIVNDDYHFAVSNIFDGVVDSGKWHVRVTAVKPVFL
jgi:hypothetical protein